MLRFIGRRGAKYPFCSLITFLFQFTRNEIDKVFLEIKIVFRPFEFLLYLSLKFFSKILDSGIIDIF